MSNQSTNLPPILPVAGGEQSILMAADMAFHASEYGRLTAELEEAQDASSLPETASARDELDDLLLRIRERMT